LKDVDDPWVMIVVGQLAPIVSEAFFNGVAASSLILRNSNHIESGDDIF
jgi:hypothetical protein